MAEQLHVIPGYKRYAITRGSRVWSYRSDRWLRPHDDGQRLRVTLRGEDRWLSLNIGSVMLLTFVGPRPAGYDCCHWDGDYRNNHLTNLRWGTRKENVQDSIRHGTKARGERHGSARLTEADVVEMRRRWAAGKRASLKCLAAEYGVDKHTVFDCVHSNTWKHVPRME